MIKDETASLVFMALGVCPEDVPFNVAVAMLICGADAQLIAKGTKLSAIVMRRALKILVDRNLLQGNIVTGAQMHGEAAPCSVHGFIMNLSSHQRLDTSSRQTS